MLVYKILRRPEWDELLAAGESLGAPVDRADGFIHFSTADQLAETLAKHFAGETGLVVLAVDAEVDGFAWEPSRGGALFPHLYATLPTAHATWVKPLPLGADGRHLFPSMA